jgi:ATP-binding protein involved in chromosome partitioning
MPNREAVFDALSRVIDPELRRPVTELDMVRDIEIDNGNVVVTITLTVAGCPLRSSFQEQVAREVSAVEGVESVELAFDVMSPDQREALVTKLRGGVEPRQISLSDKTRVLAVCSGKGGVGKSTLAANLAAAFARDGLATGILDADVYGHSIPQLLGIDQRPVVVDKMIVPPVRDELKLMSIGFFTDEAMHQFLSDVHWGELDVLVIDMPPGTGDMAISLAQRLPRAEAIIVTTPQRAAKEVAERAATMAQQTGVRVVGVVENMSGDVFGSGGGHDLALQLGVPFLGSVPLDTSVRASGDAGDPVVWTEPESDAARAIFSVAQRVVALRPPQIVKSLSVVS